MRITPLEMAKMLSQESITGKIERRITAHMMDIIILSILKHDGREISGYDLIQFLHRKFHFLMSPGTVYSQLQAMERKGLLKGRQKQGERKTLYTLTKQGTEKAEILHKSKRKIVNFVKRLFVSG